MKINILFFCLLAVLVIGCLPPSLYPLFTDNGSIFEPNLVGTWKGEDTWQVKKVRDSNTYDVTQLDKYGVKGQFLVHLVKIDNNLFFDLYPRSIKQETGDLYEVLRLPVHAFVVVRQIEPSSIKLRLIDPEKIKKMLQMDSSLIKHEIVDNEVVFTASTDELQKFMVQHVSDDQLLGDVELKRLEAKDVNEPDIPEANK